MAYSLLLMTVIMVTMTYVISYSIRFNYTYNNMIYLLIGLIHVDSSTVHIYTPRIRRKTQ